MRFSAVLAALVSLCAAAPTSPVPPGRDSAARGGTFAAEFSGKASSLLAPPEGEPVKMSTVGGWLELDGVLVKAPTAEDYFARTLVDGSGGLAAWTDAGNATGLMLSEGKLTLWRKANGEQTTLATATPAAKQVHLRFHCAGGSHYAFSYSENNGKTWTEMQGTPGAADGATSGVGKAASIALIGPGRFDFLRTKDVRGGAGMSAANPADPAPSKPAKRRASSRRRR